MQKTLKYLSVMLSSFILFSLVGLSGAVKTRAEATGKRENYSDIKKRVPITTYTIHMKR